MVHDLPWHFGRGISFVLALLCAPVPLQAQSLIAPPASQDRARPPAPEEAKLLGNHLRTRFLVGLPRVAEFEVFSLSNPNRVIIDVAEVKLRLPEQPQDKPVGLVQSFRAGLSSANHSRIILYVTEPVIVSGAKIEQAGDGRNQQLIVEIMPFAPVTPGKSVEVVEAAHTADIVDSRPIPPPPFALGAAGLQPPLPRPAVHPEVLAEKAFKPVIIIDPGHGGHDTGAMKNGAVEKEIVLAFGNILAKKLKATGRFKVLMTRDEDVFVPLGDRVSFAEKNKANLFIAVHCDYADTGSAANGATIYSLRESVANSLRRSAKGEIAGNLLSRDEVEIVKKASGDVDAVKEILADLAGARWTSQGIGPRCSHAPSSR
jgi:N-acetylmuramoyl-L-alanine amidase